MPEAKTSSLRFTLDDAQSAADRWGFNCGLAAICAVTNMTPEEIRSHLGDFERKGYTNPTLMTEILDRLGIFWKQTYRADSPTEDTSNWPEFGLVRIQWGGPWTNPEVPMRVRYRHTHWVASRRMQPLRFFDDLRKQEVFDINAMCVGGWVSAMTWACEIAPWLIRECEPKASGQWWPTHCLQVARP